MFDVDSGSRQAVHRDHQTAKVALVSVEHRVCHGCESTWNQ
jgi:hypothetical protein